MLASCSTASRVATLVETSTTIASSLTAICLERLLFCWLCRRDVSRDKSALLLLLGFVPQASLIRDGNLQGVSPPVRRAIHRRVHPAKLTHRSRSKLYTGVYSIAREAQATGAVRGSKTGCNKFFKEFLTWSECWSRSSVFSPLHLCTKMSDLFLKRVQLDR